MIKLWLLAIALLQLSLGTAIADGPALESTVRAPRPQVQRTRQVGSIITIDPATFDFARTTEQIQQIGRDVTKIKTDLAKVSEIEEGKERISKLREMLRDITQLKLLLVSVEGYLGQQREVVIREATTVRQLLSNIPTYGSIGPNLPTKQLKAELDQAYEDRARARDEVARFRTILGTIGGKASDQLQLIDKLNPDNPFSDSTLGNKLILSRINSYVSSILSYTPMVSGYRLPRTGIPAPAPMPKSSADSDQEAANQTNVISPQDDDDKDDDKSKEQEATYAKAVEAALRLYNALHDMGQFGSKIDFIQNIYDNKRRMDDYGVIDTNIGSMRDQIVFLQTTGAALQDDLNQRIDTSINQIGGRDKFTLWATLIFGLAVVVVIGSFFGLAFRDKENRVLVNPDIGLQFVTLFSIIIAIILFGVLNILEGKELAALLGGISGYILGRGTLGWKGNSSLERTSKPRASRQRPRVSRPASSSSGV